MSLVQLLLFCVELGFNRQVVWTGEAAAGGFLTVCDGSHNGAAYRILKADHSVLGGVYHAPQEFAGQSIYDIFYLQEAVRCLSRSASAENSFCWRACLPLSARMPSENCHSTVCASVSCLLRVSVGL